MNSLKNTCKINNADDFNIRKINDKTLHLV